MPTAAPTPCTQPGCSAYAASNGRCARHPRPTHWKDDRLRGNRHQRGYGRSWEKLREAVLRRDSYLCQCEDCTRANRLRPAHEVDHRIPKARGGTNALSNLRAINRDCHKAKTAREAARIRKEIQHGRQDP